jgi:hypothetical protein
MDQDATGGDVRQGGGFASDPRLLAAGAAGLLAATLAMWGFRGLPLGVIALWVSPLPLFAAGMGFGLGALFGAIGVATLALLVGSTEFGLGLFLAAFAAPVLALVLVAGRGPGGLGLPLAMLGIVPATGLLAVSLWLSDAPGGLEGALRAVSEAGMRRLGLPPDAGVVAQMARIKAAAVGFWLAIALLVNAASAGALLAKAGVCPAPAWSEARLPAWYAALPALALGLWLAAGEGADAVQLSLLLVLLVPLLLHGLAALHRATRGLGGRTFLLGGLYGALLILFLPASLCVAGYGLYDLITGPRGGRGAPPSRS